MAKKKKEMMQSRAAQYGQKILYLNIYAQYLDMDTICQVLFDFIT